MGSPRHRGRRPGVAGIIVAVVIFALIFTAGFGYLIFQDRANLASYQANANYLAAQDAASQESLAFGAKSGGGSLVITVNDTGGFPLSIVSTFVKDSTGKLSAPGVMNLGTSCTTVAGPLNLNSGGTDQFAISNACYSYVAGTTIYISLVTSRGNVFTTQFPITTSNVVATTTSVTTQTITAPGAGGGNSMVVLMAATPVQVYGGDIITDNVTVFNYANVPITGVTLNPTAPQNTTTGTAKADFQSCSGPYTPPHQQADPSGTIPLYSGSGPAPHIFFLCTYKANAGAVGGLASFSGGALGTQSSTIIYSAGVTSNLVQIGSLTNALAQGVFSSNFFFFKYSSCTNTKTPCTTNVAIPPSSPNNLPEGAVMSRQNYYVAFYVQLTNNFNTSLPILATTFEQFDQSNGGESDWWIVGTNTTMTNGAYYPSYSSSTPTLTAYPSDCTSVNGRNKPTDSKCIYINPGQTVTITLASCGPSSTTWDWGGSVGGGGSHSGCVSSSPSIGSGGSATAGFTVVAFAYKGQIFTEDLAFQGVAFTS
jgi:hypothetical protein